jgi:hypothetical protein
VYPAPPPIASCSEALTQSHGIVALIDEIWLMCRIPLPSSTVRLFRMFLEEKAVAAVRATRAPLPPGAPDDDDTLAVIKSAKAAAGVETMLWAEGVITKRIYELVHRRFLIALAPLGTVISQSEVSITTVICLNAIATRNARMHVPALFDCVCRSKPSLTLTGVPMSES